MDNDKDNDSVSFPRLLTCRDVAAILCVPVSTVHHWAVQGEGPPSFKLGKHRRFTADDVKQWLAAARHSAA